ncbi:metalloproteinase inhibitor 2-like [Clytia hemisphaerica]
MSVCFQENLKRSFAMQKLTLFLVLVFAATRFGRIDACSCFPSHPQELFCNSEFVIKALITSSGRNVTKDIFSYRSYSLTILEVFGGHQALRHLFISKQDAQNVESNDIDTFDDLEFVEANITTPLSENLCGVHLNVSESYLIFGQIRNNELQVNLCNYISYWEAVSSQVKSGIFGDYDCRCKIRTRMSPEQPVESNEIPNEGTLRSSSTCFWEMYPDEPVDECALNFLSCRKLVHPMEINDEEEQCVWVEGRDYELCQIAAESKRSEIRAALKAEDLMENEGSADNAKQGVEMMKKEEKSMKASSSQENPEKSTLSNAKKSA